jgi:hypothetical protein
MASVVTSALVRSGIPVTALLILRHALQLGNSPSAIFNLGRYSSAGIATRSGDRTPLGVTFSAPVQTDPGAHPASYTFDSVSFPEVKWPGRSVDHLPPSSAKFKDKLEQYLLSLWFFVACFRINFTFTFTIFNLTILIRHLKVVRGVKCTVNIVTFTNFVEHLVEIDFCVYSSGSS